jgi:hypothetical protein
MIFSRLEWEDSVLSFPIPHSRKKVFEIIIGIIGQKIKRRIKSMDEAVAAGRIIYTTAAGRIGGPAPISKRP